MVEPRSQRSATRKAAHRPRSEALRPQIWWGVKGVNRVFTDKDSARYAIAEKKATDLEFNTKTNIRAFSDRASATAFAARKPDLTVEAKKQNRWTVGKVSRLLAGGVSLYYILSQVHRMSPELRRQLYRIVCGKLNIKSGLKAIWAQHWSPSLYNELVFLRHRVCNI